MEKKKYVPGKAVEDAKNALEQHKNQKPGAYESQWQKPADQLLQQIQNRGPFAYDAGKDPLYRQAVDQHIRLGQKAMMDTMGKAAALTGGYGNSYAQNVSQQAYGEYLQALGARLPQFAELALRQYQAGGKDLLDRYQILSQREKDAYGRYQKIVEQHFAQQDRLQNAYDRAHDREYAQFIDDRDYAYGVEKDRADAAARAEQAKQEQERWEKDRAYEARRDQIRDAQWEKEFAENKRRYELEWAAKHAPKTGGGGGIGGIYATNVRKFQGKHSFTDKEYDAAKKRAQETGHYSPRPSGSPWSPRYDLNKVPHYQVTIR